MWGVGIMFLIIGSVPLLVNKLNGNIPLLAVRVYKNIRLVGIGIEVCYFVSLLFLPMYKNAISAIPVLVFTLWFLLYLEKLFPVDKDKQFFIK
jgi:hypothetical protein